MDPENILTKPVSLQLRARFATPQEIASRLRNKDTPLDPDVIVDRSQITISKWNPSEAEIVMRTMILRHFSLGDQEMRKPRREFNDLALITRSDIDRMEWNSYQPNDGDAVPGDEANAWRSNAQRPVTRNKIISIAAHATARLVFPKVFAWNQENESEEDGAQVMEDLMEYSGDQSDYKYTALKATIEALSQPACIVFTEYAETMRLDNNDKLVLDNILSGYIDKVVPVHELYIENFFEPNIQKQGWLLWRRVISYSLAQQKYAKYSNFGLVTPGVQCLYDDANRMFYEVYDQNMRSWEVEEVLYWNKSLRTFQILVNGILMTDVKNRMPRQDGMYPFAKFGYELIQPNFFYYKSLASKMMQDAKIINQLYSMVMDGTYLKLFPPLKNIGGETITSDVLLPGATISLSSATQEFSPLLPGSDINTGLAALGQVEASISETSMDQWMQGTGVGGRRMSAYGMSIIQQNANTLLGLFIQMISQFTKDYGKLRLGDIVQHAPLAEAMALEGAGSGAKLVFKAFLLPNKQSGGRQVTRKIQFDNTLPTKPISEETATKLSQETVEKQGGPESKMELWRISPSAFRNLQWSLMISPDTLDPMSTEMEKQYNLEAYDRGIQNPSLDPEEVTKAFLLSNYNASKRDPDRFFQKQGLGNASDPLAMAQQVAKNNGAPLPGGKPPVQPPGQQGQPQMMAQAGAQK